VTKDIDLVMGGGLKYFLKENRYDKKDLLEEFTKKGYKVIKEKKGLKENTDKKVIALFSNSHLSYEFEKDTTEQPTLTEMVDYGLNYLYERSKNEQRSSF